MIIARPLVRGGGVGRRQEFEGRVVVWIGLQMRFSGLRVASQEQYFSCQPFPVEPSVQAGLRYETHPREPMGFKRWVLYLKPACVGAARSALPNAQTDAVIYN